MNDLALKVLGYEVGARLDEGFRRGAAQVDVQDLVRPFEREVSLDALRAVVGEAMRRFAYTPGDVHADQQRAAADAWLAPRVHAALRLNRREAAQRDVWRYLGVVVLADFVRWRFPGKDEEAGTPLVRFVGPDYKQAIARLWWGAELMRNGADYSLVGVAFEVQDIADNWLRWDMAHNRAVTIACLEHLMTYDRGALATGRAAIRVGKALNRAATTIRLDALAPDAGVDSDAYRRWQGSDVNEQAWFDTLPAGPDDGDAPASSLNAVRELLATLAPALTVEAGEVSSDVPAD